MLVEANLKLQLDHCILICQSCVLEFPRLAQNTLRRDQRKREIFECFHGAVSASRASCHLVCFFLQLSFRLQRVSSGSTFVVFLQCLGLRSTTWMSLPVSACA